MALFKISRGNVKDLPKTYNDGYCYVTIDEKKMYIDTTNDSSGRICLNAAVADSAYKLISSSTNNALGVGSATIPTYFAGGIPTACSSLSLNTSGNAATATKLAKSVKINLTGSVTGSTSFDGSGDVSISTTTNHNHDDRYLKLTGGNLTGTVNSTGNLNLSGSNAYFSLGITPSGSRCYFQTYNAITNGTDDSNLQAGFGFGWAKSLTIDKSGNVNIPGDLVVSGGDITGNASSATKATKATQDGDGNVITSKYVTLDTAQTISGIKTMTSGLKVSGRCAGGGDDEGIVIGFDTNGYAGLCLGGASSARSVFYFKTDGSNPFWRYNSGSGSNLDISHPAKSGTIALTSDLGDYVKKSGDTMSGSLTVPEIVYVKNGVTSNIQSQNSSWLHYTTNSPEGHWFNKKVSVQGDIYAGTSYSDLVLTSANYNSYAPTLTGGNASGTWPISISGNAATASLAAKLNANNAKSDKATRFSGGLPVECDNLLDHSIKGSAPRWCTTSTNPCTSSTDSNLSTFNVPDSRIYWVTATGTLINQPAQYGYILDIGNGAERHQIWMSQPAGDLWHRGGNGSGWGCNWKIIFDNTNYYNYALPLSGGTLTGGLTFSGSNGISTRHIDGENVTFAGDLYLNYGRSAPIHVGNGGHYTISADGSYYSGTCAGSSYATRLSSIRTVYGNSHAEALQNEFNNYKSSVARNSLLSYYSSAYSNGSYYMGYFLSGYDSNPYGGFFVAHYGTPYYVGIASGSFSQHQLWKSGDAIYGAVWNDYAECRESQDDEPGYVLIENGDDTLSKSTERLQQFAGISSDTWGFSQGKTEKAKTHIAVAGRVLAYPYQNRNKYKPGDAVCTAPGGTVDIMTEEEIAKYPHRIVGTVSCVPEYEEWGGGENADRDPVKVNGRIWIKVV